MKLFTKKTKIPTFHYELADGAMGKGKGHKELASLMTKHLSNSHENYFKQSWNGKEWFIMTPETYDVYWIEGM